ncbi:MAG: virginiamycin lyase [Actinomycetota bacterium]|jgi:streptogramin lyase|nr:virginiamycin lyase [Actinomycetota bacterium]
MSDLETLLAPLLDSAPDPAPLAVVSARASSIRRRRRVRVGVLGVLAVAAAAGGIAAALPRDTNGVSTVGPPPVATAPPSLTIGSPRPLPVGAMDVVSAYGSIWVTQADQVARLDPVNGVVVARIRVPGLSDFRNVTAGAGSIWVDDTGTEAVTRIDPMTNRVTATISMHGSEFDPDGIAFLGGRLWVVRPVPNDVSRGDVVVIDPATNRIAHQVRIPRTFDVLAGSDALWYVADSMSGRGQLVRLDPRTLQTKVVRRNVTALVAIADGGIWLETDRGVIEIDEHTGAQLGGVIPVGRVVNATAAVADGVLWLAWQPDSDSPGSVTPYDAVTHRALSKPVPVGLPILTVTMTRGAVWVAVYSQDGLTRIPFSH